MSIKKCFVCVIVAIGVVGIIFCCSVSLTVLLSVSNYTLHYFTLRARSTQMIPIDDAHAFQNFTSLLLLLDSLVEMAEKSGFLKHNFRSKTNVPHKLRGKW